MDVPLVVVRTRGVDSSTLREEGGVLIAPNIEGINVMAADYDIYDRTVERTIAVCVHVVPSAPALTDLDQWEVVEEADIHAPGPLEVTDAYGQRLESLSMEIETLTGRIRVRVLARQRGGATATVHILIWRSSAPAPLARFRHLDGISFANFGSHSAPVESPATPSAVSTDHVTTERLSTTGPVPLGSGWRDVVGALATVPGPELQVSLDAAALGPTPSQIDVAREVDTWFALVDTLPAHIRHTLFPSLDLVTKAESENLRTMLVDTWNSALSGAGDSEVPNDAATAAYRFIGEFLPIAERDGTVLVVDTRRGPLHGCVSLFDRTEADSAGPRFRSIGALLHDLAEALIGSSTFLDAAPTYRDGQLLWRWG